MGQGLDPQDLTQRGLADSELRSVIKYCLLYIATPRGSKARSSGRRCREEGEVET